MPPKKTQDVAAQPAQAPTPDAQLAAAPVDPVEALSKKLDKMVDIMSVLAVKVNKLEDEKPVPDSAAPAKPRYSTTEIDRDAFNKRVPRQWRELIDTILGPDFEAEVNDSNGNWMLTIIVPEYLDRRVGSERKDGKDTSTGLVRRSSDLADVENWCKLVRERIVERYPKFVPGWQPKIQ
jgi:hypothetical protein